MVENVWDYLRPPALVPSERRGDFYGGWISADLRGPFKGAAGTAGW